MRALLEFSDSSKYRLFASDILEKSNEHKPEVYVFSDNYQKYSLYQNLFYLYWV